MIAFEELFPFNELKQLIADLKAEESKLASGRESFSKKYQTTLNQEIALIAKLKKQISDMGKGGNLGGLGDEVEAVSKRMKTYKELISSLTTAEVANSASIENLKGALALLNKQYEQLDPTAKDFAQSQKDIAQKVGYVKQAIDSQLVVMKEANRVIKQTEGQYNKLSAETNQLRKSLKSLDDAFDSTTGAINKNNSKAVELQRQIERNDRALKGMDATMGMHQRKVGDYTGAVNGLKDGFLQLVGIAGAVDLAVKAITKSIEVISAFERYRSVIKFASKDTADFNKNMQFIEDIADRTGTEIEILYQKYASFAAAAKASNLTLKETQGVFGAVVTAAGALKMSNDALGLSLKAITDMLNKGKIGAEELRQQLGDHLPGAMQLFATLAGVSTQELDKMMKKGELLTSDIFPKMEKGFGEIFGKTANENVDTISGSFNRLTNQLKLFVAAFGENAGIASFFSTINNGLADTAKYLRDLIKSDSWIEFMLAMGNPVGALMGSQRYKQDQAALAARPLNAQGQLNKFRGLSPTEQQRMISSQSAVAANAKAEFDATKATPYNKKERDELAKFATEQYAILNSYKKIIKETQVKTKAAKEETEAVKELRKEYSKLREELREGTIKNENYTTTSEGAAKSARFNDLKAQLKAIDEAAGVSKPRAEKEKLNKFEEDLKELGKRADVVINRIGQSLDKNLPFPEGVINDWFKLYDAAEKYGKLIGEELPSKMRNLDAVLRPANYSVSAIQGNTTIDTRSAITPDANGQTKSMKDFFGSGKVSAQMDDYINSVKQQGFETLELASAFSRRLKGLKESERDELKAIQDEIHKAQMDGNKKLEETETARLDAALARIQVERDMRRRAIEEGYNLAQIMGQAISDIQTNFNNRDIERINKKKDFELSLVANNKNAQTKIEEDAARKILEIRRRQARQDKAAALFSIALNTSQAVMSILSTGGGTRFADLGISAGILTAFAIAQGAFQAAAVASKPLPEFAKGTQNAPEGLALVGEKGAELRESKGKYYYYDRPTVTDLKSGDKVFTASETRRMLKDSAISDNIERQFQRDVSGISTTNVSYTIDTTAIVEGIGRKLKEAFGEQPIIGQVLSGGEIQTFVRTKSQLTQYYNKKHF